MASNLSGLGVVGALACVLFILWRRYLGAEVAMVAFRWGKQTPPPPQLLGSKSNSLKKQTNAFGIEEGDASVFLAENIIPLLDFNWQETEPLKFRPFKKKYHLTMGLSNLPISQLLEFDRNYLTRLHLRKQIITTHHEIAIQASPCISPAVVEFYTWLVGVYLPTRYPTLFTLETENKAENKGLKNLATGEILPLVPPPQDVLATLKLLGENVDEDFLFMSLDDREGGKEGEGEYRLKGYVTCFPSGFNTREKFGMRLSEIHKPVPGYKEKLELSMGRFFGRVGVGRVVGRSNWAITTNDHLFSPGGTHLYAGMKAEDETAEIDINNTYLRTERQTLHRLPKTKALVFAFKTYLYPLSEVKEEGSGEALAEAIEGLESGSVPEMYFYKKGVVWGEGVKSFLRS